MPTYHCTSGYGSSLVEGVDSAKGAAVRHACDVLVDGRPPVLHVKVVDDQCVTTEWTAFMGYAPMRVVNCVPNRGSTLAEAVDSLRGLGKALSRVVIVDADTSSYLFCAPPSPNGAVYHIATLRDGVLTVNCRPVHVGVYDRGTIDIGHLLPSVG